MLHGLGDSGHGWADIAAQFTPLLPHVRFIFPHAPERPITLNMGFRMPGWYDIVSLEGINRKEDEAGIQESARWGRHMWVFCWCFVDGAHGCEYNCTGMWRSWLLN